MVKQSISISMIVSMGLFFVTCSTFIGGDKMHRVRKSHSQSNGQTPHMDFTPPPESQFFERSKTYLYRSKTKVQSYHGEGNSHRKRPPYNNQAQNGTKEKNRSVAINFHKVIEHHIEKTVHDQGTFSKRSSHHPSNGLYGFLSHRFSSRRYREHHCKSHQTTGDHLSNLSCCKKEVFYQSQILYSDQKHHHRSHCAHKNH